MGKVSWTIESSVDKDYIFERAKMLGWLDNPQKVQVKRYQGMETWYIIEPYEGGCSCPDLVYPPKEIGNAR
jgi:hypothetical protein